MSNASNNSSYSIRTISSAHFRKIELKTGSDHIRRTLVAVSISNHS